MEDTSKPPEKPVPEPSAGGGIDVSGGDVRAGRDIVGGDIRIGGDSITGGSVTVQRGFSAADVQKLVLAVGGLVFVTAAFFFVIGAIAAGSLLAAINRPVGSSMDAAISMGTKLDALQSLQPGQKFQVTFTEDELSSYFRFVLGPALGISDGKARLLDEPGQLALAGALDSAGGLPFLAQLSATTGNVPFQVTGAWVKILPTPEGVSFGWIPVTPFAQNLNDRLNGLLFGNVQFDRLFQTGGGTARPPTGGNFITVVGTAK